MKKIFLFCLTVLAILVLSGCSKEERTAKVSTRDEFLEAVKNSAPMVLTADIDFEGYVWEPISAKCDINGNGHTLKNIRYVAATGDNIGLFSNEERLSISNINFENLYIAYYGKGSNVGGIVGRWAGEKGLYLENIKISGNIYAPGASCVGGCIGYIGDKGSGYSKNIKNITTDVDVFAKDNVGGLVGRIGYYENLDSLFDKIMGNSGTKVPEIEFEIENIENYGDIEAKTTHAGGVFGAIYTREGEISNCKNYGSITAQEFIGGIGGRIYTPSINKAENHGVVKSSADNSDSDCYIGGISGILQTTAPSSELQNYIDISCKGNYVGGIAGFLSADTQLNESKNTGKIVGTKYAGGITGGAGDSSQLIKCTNSGEISAHESAGGLCGISVNTFISRCENSGPVQAVNNAGGLVGYYTVSDTDAEGAVVYSTNSGKVTATNSESGYSAGIVGSTDAKKLEDIDTNTQNGQVSGGKSDQLVNYVSE